MDKWQKEHIAQNIKYLVEHLRLNAYVLTTFVTTGILEIEDIWILEEEKDQLSRNLKCFEIIKEKPIPRVYEKLTAVLEGTNQGDAANLLKVYHNKRKTNDSNITQF